MPNPSAETINGLARDLMRAEGVSDVPALSDAFLWKVLTDIDYELDRAHRRSGGNTPSVRSSETGFDLVSDSAIDNAAGVTTSDVTITADSNSFPDSAGAAVIWDQDMPDIFFYTSKTSTLFSGVTGLAFAHEDNDAIQALYKLRTDFKNFRRSEEYGDGVQLNGNPLFYMEGPPMGGHFSMVDDGTSKYLWLPKGSGGSAAVLYDKTNEEIDDSADLVAYGPDWSFFYAWRCIELGVFGRGDYELMGLAKSKGDAIKLDLLKSKNVGRRLRIRPMMMPTRHHPEFDE